MYYLQLYCNYAFKRVYELHISALLGVISALLGVMSALLGEISVLLQGRSILFGRSGKCRTIVL